MFLEFECTHTFVHFRPHPSWLAEIELNPIADSPSERRRNEFAQGWGGGS
jgi:hypothetical protein